jgi:two-component system, NarL family, nitrate/nitrite response regulator NarL
MSPEIPLRVLVVDDHAGIRLGIESLIEAEAPRMRSVGAVGTLVEAIAHTQRHQPHVVVLDVNLGGEDGLSLIPLLHRAAPCVVVVLTSLQDPHIAERAHRLGAFGCLQKTAPADELLACIVSAHAAQESAHGAIPLNAGGAVSYDGGSKHP